MDKGKKLVRTGKNEGEYWSAVAKADKNDVALKALLAARKRIQKELEINSNDAVTLLLATADIYAGSLARMK